MTQSPILVTGVPRSGTTWLARALANAAGTSLTGREPMNPRSGQYGLGGTLTTWARVTAFTPRQSRALSTSYRGLNPFVYSRYGHRQWAAPWPRTRVIIKDPFAMLSLPAIVRATGAVPVLIYRHPAAVLASYRRMGWTADLDELGTVVPPEARPIGFAMSADSRVDHTEGSDASDMARFWVMLNSLAVSDLELVDDAVVVAHEELAAGGGAAMALLFEAIGLRGGTMADLLPRPAGAGGAGAPSPTALHNFDRPPEAVAASWRSQVSAADVAEVEAIAAPTLRALEARSVGLA